MNAPTVVPTVETLVPPRYGGRHVIAATQSVHLSSQYPNFTYKTMYLKLAVRAGNPCSQCHVCHLTL
jgi:hypothetical protein